MDNRKIEKKRKKENYEKERKNPRLSLTLKKSPEAPLSQRPYYYSTA